MRLRHVAPAVLVLVVLAGCPGVPQPGDDDALDMNRSLSSSCESTDSEAVCTGTLEVRVRNSTGTPTTEAPELTVEGFDGPDSELTEVENDCDTELEPNEGCSASYEFTVPPGTQFTVEADAGSHTGFLSGTIG
jgi:hypothetical protein